MQIIRLTESNKRAGLVLFGIILLLSGMYYRSVTRNQSPVVKSAELSAPQLDICVRINSATEKEFQTLPGVNEKLAATIVKYRNRIKGFSSLEGLKDIYGMSEKKYSELQPYIDWDTPKSKYLSNSYANPSLTKRKEPQPFSNDETHSEPKPNWKTRDHFENKNLLVEVNQADSIELIRVPGIGPKTAGKIIRFRDALGGFHSIDQLKEVWGISEENFERMKNHLALTSPNSIKKIEINSISKEDLANHPYLTWTDAKIITAYREEHGNFANIDELKKVKAIDPSAIEKLKPYLSL